MNAALDPSPAPPEAPASLLERAGLILDQLLMVFGGVEEIAASPGPHHPELKGLPAWLRSLERMIHHLLLLLALQLLEQGHRPRPRATAPGPENLASRSVAALFLHPHPPGPRRVIPRICTRDLAERKPAPPGAAPPEASMAPEHPLRLARRLAEAVRVLADPAPFVRRLADRIARAEAAAGRTLDINLRRIHLDRSGVPRPRYSLMDDLELALQAIGLRRDPGG